MFDGVFMFELREKLIVEFEVNANLILGQCIAF